MQVAIGKGRKPPRWFTDVPDAGPMDEFYLSAFWDLSTTRGIGFAPGPIPWNRIRDYAEYVGLDKDVGFAFAAVIRRLDVHYLDVLASQSAGSTGEGGKSSLPWENE